MKRDMKNTEKKMDDQEIIRLYWQRDERAIYETQFAYRDFCYRISYNILRNQEDAKECVNDAYLKVWESIPPACPESLKRWIGKITWNLSVNRWKYNRRGKRSSEITVIWEEMDKCIPSRKMVEDILSAEWTRDLIHSWVQQLPECSRILFTQRYWYGESVKDIALEHGRTPGAIAKDLYNLRKQLRHHLEQVNRK